MVVLLTLSFGDNVTTRYDHGLCHDDDDGDQDKGEVRPARSSRVHGDHAGLLPDYPRRMRPWRLCMLGRCIEIGCSSYHVNDPLVPSSLDAVHQLSLQLDPIAS